MLQPDLPDLLRDLGMVYERKGLSAACHPILRTVPETIAASRRMLKTYLRHLRGQPSSYPN